MISLVVATGGRRQYNGVTEARESFRRFAHGHAPQPVHPVVARAASKAPRQKIGDVVKIGHCYLAASDHGPNPLWKPVSLLHQQLGKRELGKRRWRPSPDAGMSASIEG
jgi:hypothetical protein